MSVIHRMGVLSFFILVAAMFVIPFHSLTQRLRFALVRYENPFRVASLSLAVTGFLSMFYLQFQFPGLAGIDVRAQYGQGSFFSGDSFGILVLNMAVSFMGKMGLLFPLAIMGIVAYTWKRPKDALDKFVLLAMLVFLPILSMRDYITEFVTPLVAILATFTIFWLVARQKRRLKVIAVATVAVLVIGSMGFAWVMKDYWAKRYATDAAISESIYTTGLYVRTHVSGSLDTNHGLLGGQITAISVTPSLPLGGASLHWFSSQQLIFGFINGSNVQVKLRDVLSLSFNTDELYAPQNVRNAETDWETIMYGHLTDIGVSRMLDRYDVHFLFVDETLPRNTFRSYSLDRDSPFTRDVESSRYAVFNLPGQTIYYIG
jgi:hypothetical protein